MPDLTTVGSLLLPLLTGAGGWLIGGRKRRIDNEVSAFDLYERALKAQGRTEEMLRQSQRENAQTMQRLDDCERARIDLTEDMERLREQVTRLAAVTANTGGPV